MRHIIYRYNLNTSLFILVALFVFMLCFNARAALIERDWQVPDDAALTYDTTTGLEWLDLTRTSDMSYDEVALQLNSGGIFEGFLYASDIQARQLFDAIALPEIDLGLSMYGPKISELLSYWGILWEFTPTSGRSEFIISNIEELPIGQHWTGRVVWSDLGDTGVAAKFLTVENVYKHSIIGSALVRSATNVQVDGDVNRDGATNLGDYFVVLQVVMGNSVASGIEPGHADFYPPGTPDGIIDLSDLILLKSIIF